MNMICFGWNMKAKNDGLDNWYINQITLVFTDKHKVTYVGTSLYEI